MGKTSRLSAFQKRWIIIIAFSATILTISGISQLRFNREQDAQVSTIEELPLTLETAEAVELKIAELMVANCFSTEKANNSPSDACYAFDGASSHLSSKNLQRLQTVYGKVVELKKNDPKEIKKRADAEREQTRLQGQGYIRSGMSQLKEAAIIGDSDPLKACKRAMEGVRLIEKGFTIDPTLESEVDYAQTLELIGQYKQLCEI
jgi:hypothetical protein